MRGINRQICSYVMLNGNITDVIGGGELWLSKGLAESVVSIELLLGEREGVV
jgi:hypothetical protein